MIIVLKPEATKKDAQEIIRRIAALGLKPLYMPGTERTVLGAIGDERVIGKLRIENHPLVERVSPVLTPYKLVSREIHPRDTVVRIGGVPLGGKYFAVIAGPCAVESPRQMYLTAQAVKRAGAKCLRGGAYKPRTSPYSFQGLGLEGLEILRDVGRDRGRRGCRCCRGRALRLRLPGRRAEHAELPAAEGAGAEPETGHPETRDGGHRGRPAPGRRVRPIRRKSQCDSVRARHPDFRDGDTEHS